jgi:uncharacterized protein (TIGR03437 family)
MFREFFMIGLLATSGASASVSAGSLPAISLGEAVVDAQGGASIDVALMPGDQPITALQFDLQYQNQALSISESLGGAAVGAGKSLWTSSPPGATTRILIAGLNATPLGAGVVVTLAVQTKGGVWPDLFALEVTNVAGSDGGGHAVFIEAANGSVTVPGPVVLAVTNAASYAGGAVAPGEIVVIWGRSLSGAATNTLQLASDGSVSSSLAGTSVLFDGIPAPLTYTNANQLCAIVPYEVAGHSQTSLQVGYQGIWSAPFVSPVANSSPGIFTLNGSGQGQGAILNQDGTVNGPGNPASRGSIVSVYATGEGQTDPPGVDGSIVQAPNLRRPLLPVTGSIGGQTAEVTYAGSAAGQVSGLLQVNMRIPPSVSPGDTVTVLITIGGNSQPGVTMAVQ